MTDIGKESQVANLQEYISREPGRIQAAIDDEKQNPWKAAIINELIVTCIYTKEHEFDPQKALQDAITWHCEVALNPNVSSDAQRLLDAALESAAVVCLAESIELIGPGDDAYNTALVHAAAAIRSRINSNPLAEAQARIAELEKDSYSAGYEQAHDDTVEGGYSPEQRLEDYLAAMKESDNE